MKHEAIRSLFSRSHDTVFSKLGVFLAGPTPPSGEMTTGWRRVIVDKLVNDSRLDPSMIVVSPEPITGNWSEINNPNPKSELEKVRNQQIPWELQYLKLCDITAFWLPTYWNKEKSEVFPANIGPTSRWEFGYFLQEYLKDPKGKHFIIGSPEDAESLNWAKQMTAANGIKWHTLKNNEKSKLVADSFIDEIAETLLQNKWNYNE
ncbi:nucleoside 2-deoxyribosyltransferase domain-containing protein [Kordia sp.]|uniref:nucleoside 2-deoxyribosyltransferase domain-containing protein n=1 Tax=Kordia sp. TaxID=1965332 RepID=UPI003D6A905C